MIYYFLYPKKIIIGSSVFHGGWTNECLRVEQYPQAWKTRIRQEPKMRENSLYL